MKLDLRVHNPLASVNRGRRAAAVAEFALVAPIIATLLVGMFELSRGLQVKQILSDGARKGCSTGIKPGKIDTDIKNDVNNILTDNGIDYTKATITILVRDVAYTSANPPKEFDKVSIQVSVPISTVYWVTTFFLTSQELESETYVMMRQG